MEQETQDFLTAHEAAKWLRVSPWTLNQWRVRGIGPSYFNLAAHTIRYRKVDLKAWLQGRRVDGFVDTGDNEEQEIA